MVQSTAMRDMTRRPMILVVDDQPANIRLLYDILRSEHDVVMATDGQTALDLCTVQMPDLLLLDLIMPGMSGEEVCRRLKEDEQTRALPIIFVTAKNNPEEEAHSLEIGAADFITKPFHPKVVLARVRTQLALRSQAEALRSLALIDALTGIANRRQFDVVIAAEWRRCARMRRPLALLMIDIDSFKRFNDRYGHQAGDECLQKLASRLRMTLQRSHDLVARYGGEEFICVLPETPAEGAVAKAVELEQAVRALAIEHETSTVGSVVTISVGVAVVVPVPDEPHANILAIADRALYMAKRAGGGQIKLFNEDALSVG